MSPSDVPSQVAGFGARGGCYDPAAVTCNACAPPSYCTSTTLADAEASHLLVEDPRAKSQATMIYVQNMKIQEIMKESEICVLQFPWYDKLLHQSLVIMV